MSTLTLPEFNVTVHALVLAVLFPLTVFEIMVEYKPAHAWALPVPSVPQVHFAVLVVLSYQPLIGATVLFNLAL